LIASGTGRSHDSGLTSLLDFEPNEEPKVTPGPAKRSPTAFMDLLKKYVHSKTLLESASIMAENSKYNENTKPNLGE